VLEGLEEDVVVLVVFSRVLLLGKRVIVEFDKIDVFGTPVGLCTVPETSRFARDGKTDHARVVAIANVHSVMTARKDRRLADALSSSDLVTPDGMPLVWALKLSGCRQATRVTGIDVMRATLEVGLEANLGHFFYGSTPEVLDALEREVRNAFPDVNICGTLSPPFRPLSREEKDEHVEMIKASGAEIVWVGLGMPKQELWMHEIRDELPGVTLVGVGAAFDWFAGRMKRAPRWIQNAGLEWLFRLAHEPGRLWRRYLSTNPGFMVLLLRRWIAGFVGRV